MGYWILLGLIACTVGMVIVALHAIETRQQAPDLVNALAPVNGASETHRQSKATTALCSPVVWVALVHDAVVDPWPIYLARANRTTQVEVRRLPRLTIREIETTLIGRDDQAPIAIMAFQVGLDDLLAGTSLDDFSGSLAEVLSLLESRGTLAVVGTIPNLSSSGLARELGVSPRDLSQVERVWNEAIADIAHVHEAEILDLSAIGATPPSVESVADLTKALHSQFDQEGLAAMFASVIARAESRAQPSVPQP